MPKTRINCPNCRQPIMADVEQLFDVAQDPSAKQRLLSGAPNFVQCPNCGYQGALATPIVYHDPQKELLLTYVPPEINMPRDEQERLIGSLINQVMAHLPQEQRKGYLLRPQPALTLQGLVERVLEAEGITKEMIQAQQQRLNLVQRMADARSEDVLDEIIRQEDKKIDADFFNLLARLYEASAANGDQNSARMLAGLQQKLLTSTTVGKQLAEQSKEVEAAVHSLQDSGAELTREKLLDLVLEAPTDTRLSVLVSLARQGMDYEFFQLLTQRIESAQGPEKDRLDKLREKILQLTAAVDKQMEARQAAARKNLTELLKAPDITAATEQNLEAIDDYFVQIVNSEMEAARKTGDLEKISKLKKILDVLDRASAPPPEIAMLEELLDIDNDKARMAWLEAHRQEITPDFVNAVTGILAQSGETEDEQMKERLEATYRAVLRFSMQSNLK